MSGVKDVWKSPCVWLYKVVRACMGWLKARGRAMVNGVCVKEGSE